MMPSSPVEAVMMLRFAGVDPRVRVEQVSNKNKQFEMGCGVFSASQRVVLLL